MKLKLMGVFDNELKKISKHYEGIERLRQQLNERIEMVEQMEIENLETHMALEHKLRQSQRSHIINKATSGTQTELSWSKVFEKERVLDVKEGDIEIMKFKMKQELETRERELFRKQRILDEKEKTVEQQNLELTYKQRELNMRLKNAILQPLNMLDPNLNQRLSQIKNTPDYYKLLNLDSDPGYAEFRTKDENLKLLSGLTGEVHLRADGLLKFEYTLLMERQKTAITKEYMENELRMIEAERTEIIRDRERYKNLVDMERDILEAQKVLEEQKNEYKDLLDRLKKH